MKLTLYGQDGEKGWAKTITLEELIAIQVETVGDLWAHAEEGVNESCYLRVARWNYQAERWEAFAGIKCMDYRFPEAPDATDEETAELAAKKINEGFSWSTNGRTRIVYNMPVWQSDTPRKREEELIGLLKLASQYLKHPDVQSLPFAMRASALHQRIAKAIGDEL